MQFDANGLIPAVVQHARSGEVLMLGYMNEAALHATLESGLVTFWSRSRQALWRKGETSGNLLRLVEVRHDCDGDALLVQAEPDGPTCHTGQPSCFHRTLHDDLTTTRPPASGVLARLQDTIRQRRASDDTESYTVRLLRGGVDRIGKKIGEEATEVVIAAKNAAPAELIYEAADLVYHLLVLLESQQVPLDAVFEELQRRTSAPSAGTIQPDK